MRIWKVLVVACAVALLPLSGVSAFDITSVNLHLYLSGLKVAQAPAIVENYLVLSASGPYRYVGAAFSHESWRSVHSFEVNRYGIFVLAVPIPYGDESLIRYRLVLDGLWAADPFNPRVDRDRATGASMSIASIPSRPRTVLGVWDPAGDGVATFYFEGEPGQRVTVAGSFNAWDPFIHDLVEVSRGRYELQLRLDPGEYYYVFMYRGERIADPLNSRLLYGRDGRPVSALTMSSGG
ncbi:MAG: glycogen-binding domain-containing protein [Spirochaetia bacterium]|jgi:hypothetical protein|nr:glycogen-binding domain-containing protein [Spirochaetia bacterium]